MRLTEATLRKIILEELYNYYRDLGMKTISSDQKLIKKMYRKMAAKTHPDRGGSTEDMQKVNAAYEILSDEEKKNQLDQGLYNSAIKARESNPDAKFDGNTGLALSPENIEALKAIVGRQSSGNQAQRSSSMEDYLKFTKYKSELFSGAMAVAQERLKQGNLDAAKAFMKIANAIRAAQNMEDLENYSQFANK